MAFTEDLEGFFDVCDFAVVATVKPLAGPAFKLRVIFNTPTQELQIFDSSVEAGTPNVLAISSDVVKIDNKSTLTIGSKTYRVTKKEDDGTGVSTVYLA